MASPSGPGSSCPWSAMFVIAKPSGTMTRIGSSSRSSAPRQVTRIRAGPSCGAHRSSVQAHPDAADGQLVAEAERHRPVDAVAVDVRAVRAALVLHEPGPAAEGEHRVVGADKVVLHVDRVVHVAADGVDRPQRNRRADRRHVVRRLEDAEPADPRARGDLRLLGVAQVAEQRAGEAQEDQVQENDEADLEDEQEKPQDVAGQPRTWNSISVPPIRMTSPGPSAIWVTGWPLTVDPLRLPRSVKP